MTISLGEQAIEQRVKRVRSIIREQGDVFLFFFPNRGFITVLDTLPVSGHKFFKGTPLLPEPMLEAFPMSFVGRYDRNVLARWLFSDMHGAISSCAS
jgi:hypothetical protein|tara:strand:- start:5878 stop:6168 length:291 start_codon:yes stop_codon:yes gene_type:complete